ncbi:hypothetical protein OH492_10110 [Vibrio chagasii]|nr:hypothetical protein [Vibrio chagasii]
MAERLSIGSGQDTLRPMNRLWLSIAALVILAISTSLAAKTGWSKDEQGQFEVNATPQRIIVLEFLIC